MWYKKLKLINIHTEAIYSIQHRYNMELYILHKNNMLNDELLSFVNSLTKIPYQQKNSKIIYKLLTKKEDLCEGVYKGFALSDIFRHLDDRYIIDIVTIATIATANNKNYGYPSLHDFYDILASRQVPIRGDTIAQLISFCDEIGPLSKINICDVEYTSSLDKKLYLNGIGSFDELSHFWDDSSSSALLTNIKQKLDIIEKSNVITKKCYISALRECCCGYGIKLLKFMYPDESIKVFGKSIKNTLNWDKFVNFVEFLYNLDDVVPTDCREIIVRNIIARHGCNNIINNITMNDTVGRPSVLLISTFHRKLAAIRTDTYKYSILFTNVDFPENRYIIHQYYNALISSKAVLTQIDLVIAMVYGFNFGWQPYYKLTIDGLCNLLLKYIIQSTPLHTVQSMLTIYTTKIFSEECMILVNLLLSTLRNIKVRF